MPSLTLFPLNYLQPVHCWDQLGRVLVVNPSWFSELGSPTINQNQRKVSGSHTIFNWIGSLALLKEQVALYPGPSLVYPWLLSGHCFYEDLNLWKVQTLLLDIVIGVCLHISGRSSLQNSVSGGVQDQVGWNPEQPNLVRGLEVGGPAGGSGLELLVPYNPSLSVIL